MKKGCLIKISEAKQIDDWRNKCFTNKLAIYIKSKKVANTRWHLIHMCHNNKKEVVFSLKAEVLNESKNNET